ncbi:MAG TPA: hypothetical protein DG754_00705, partial [Bacteroidales bacterium]|nr:hypothetical protein [Bacteroidales bacterium]
QVIAQVLNPKLRGWFEYLRHTKSKGLFRDLDSWIHEGYDISG